MVESRLASSRVCRRTRGCRSPNASRVASRVSRAAATALRASPPEAVDAILAGDDGTADELL
eukprot:6592408-Prymnesium_polylepis.1